MERLKFDNIYDLSAFMFQMACDEDVTITAVLFYDKAQELLRCLLDYDEVDIGHINFAHEDYGYDREYYITLDSTLTLDVEPVKYNDRYKNIDTDVLLLDGDASSKIITINEDSSKFELVFEKEDEDCNDCENCEENDNCEFWSLAKVLDYIFSIIED